MKRKIPLIVLALFCCIVILTIGSSFGTPFFAEPEGCSGTACPDSVDESGTHYYNALPDNGRYLCCEQECSRNFAGNNYSSPPPE